MSWALVWVLALAMVSTAWCRSNLHARATYCGKELADALALVCDNSYYGGFFRGERSLPGMRDSKLALGFLRRRKRDGIVDECCRKTCSVPELQTYCGDNSQDA